MTGYKSKRAAARDKLEDDDTQVYQDHDDALTIAYQSGYYDGKKAAQPAQEPVGVVCVDTSHAHIVYGSQYLGRQPDKKTAMFFKDCEVGEQLYTLPQQRPWVGLEGEEIRYLWEEATKPDRSTMTMVTSFAKDIEAKLKEKNNA